MNEKKQVLWHQGEIGPDAVLRDVVKNQFNILVASANDGVIYRRLGTGIGWKQITVLGTGDHVFGVCTDKEGNFYAGTRTGSILKADKDGLEWRIVRQKKWEGSVMKLAAGKGMILAILDRSAINRPNTFLKSIDSGETWFEFNGGVANACSIEFLNGTFYVGSKSKNLYYGTGNGKFVNVEWDRLSHKFEGARCLGYNEATKTFFAGGHQLATSLDGCSWWSKFDLTAHPELGERNIQAIVPVNEDTFLLGEDMMMFRYRNALFEPVGAIGKGSVLGAVLHDDRIICATSAGERFILLEDLDIAGEPPTPPTPPTPPIPPVPPTPESLEKRVENVLVDMERDIALLREMVKGK